MPLGQLAFIPPLPSGGINSAPQIDGAVVDTKDNPYGNQIIAENEQIRATTITSAQLLALKGADVNVVDSPGAGYALVIESVSMRQNFKTAAYTLNAGTLKVYLGPSANALPVTADLSAILTQGATSDIIGSPGLVAGPATQANTENQPLVLGNTGAAQFTVGAGTLDVVVVYVIVQM